MCNKNIKDLATDFLSRDDREALFCTDSYNSLIKSWTLYCHSTRFKKNKQEREKVEKRMIKLAEQKNEVFLSEAFLYDKTTIPDFLIEELIKAAKSISSKE